MSDTAETTSTAETAQQFRTELRHPFFDMPGPPNWLDCLDAIDRTACLIELFSYLDLGSDTEEGLSSRAAAAYGLLSAMMRDTLKYSTRRLAVLNRKRQKKKRRNARYLSALSKSLATLGSADRDSVLNAMAIQLQVTRSDIDAYIDKAAAE